MQQHLTQRQQLEDTLAQLEHDQRITHRKIIRTQVQLELLNQKELLHQTNHTQNTQQNLRITTSNQSNNNNSSSSDEDNNDEENNQNPDSTDTNAANNDNDADSDDREPFRFPNGTPIYSGDLVKLLNPSNEEQEKGEVVGSTPKRLRIELQNGDIVLRQPENLEPDQDSQSSQSE